MKVFLKYISKNMLEKKGRFFLLLFSIAISAALLVASTGMVDVIIDSFSGEAAKVADVTIVSKADDPYMKQENVDTAGLKDVIYELQTTGIKNEDDKIKYVGLHGRKSYDGAMVEGNSDFLGSETQPSCILSKRIADELGLKTGDSLKLFLAGEEISFRVKALSANENLFYGDTKTQYSILVPYEYMDQKLQAEGGYNAILANVEEGTSADFVKSFNEANKDLEAIDHQSVVVVDSSLNIGLYSMMAIVVIVSCIIIHGVFKLIMTERLSVIGTFMSQGATKKKVERIVLLEGLLYGVLGGIVGCAIGEVLLFVIGRMTSPLADYGIYNEFKINPTFIAIGMIFSIVLSVASAYFPVRSVRKLEVKDVILNRAEQKRSNRIVKPIIGAVLLGFSVLVFFLNDTVINATALLGFFAAYAGIVLLVPTVVKWITGLLAGVFKGNATIFLALNNIRSSKLLRNNIVLIVVSLGSVLMIGSFGTSMTKLVKDAYEKMAYDYDINGIISIDPNHATTDMLMEKLETTEGIEKKSISPEYYAEAKVDGELAVATGVDPKAHEKLLDGYFGFASNEGYQDFLRSEGNVVVLTTKIANKIEKKIGDTVTLDVNSHEVSFRVIGIYDGKAYNNGLSILINQDVMKKEFNIREANNIYFSVSGDPVKVENSIKSYLASLGSTYMTRDEEAKQNDDNNQQMVMLFEIISYLAMIIASIGVFNNITICFLQRKRELAVMSSVGMNKGGRRRLILAESLICVVLSILIATPFAFLLADLMTGFCYFIGIAMDVFFDWSTVPLYAAVITGVIFIASLSTMIKSRKLSIVQELKYE